VLFKEEDGELTPTAHRLHNFVNTSIFALCEIINANLYVDLNLKCKACFNTVNVSEDKASFPEIIVEAEEAFEISVQTKNAVAHLKEYLSNVDVDVHMTLLTKLYKDTAANMVLTTGTFGSVQHIYKLPAWEEEQIATFDDHQVVKFLIDRASVVYGGFELILNDHGAYDSFLSNVVASHGEYSSYPQARALAKGETASLKDWFELWGKNNIATKKSDELVGEYHKLYTRTRYISKALDTRVDYRTKLTLWSCVAAIVGGGATFAGICYAGAVAALATCANPSLWAVCPISLSATIGCVVATVGGTITGSVVGCR